MLRAQRIMALIVSRGQKAVAGEGSAAVLHQVFRAWLWSVRRIIPAIQDLLGSYIHGDNSGGARSSRSVLYGAYQPTSIHVEPKCLDPTDVNHRRSELQHLRSQSLYFSPRSQKGRRIYQGRKRTVCFAFTKSRHRKLREF